MSLEDKPARFRIKTWRDEKGVLYVLPIMFANLNDGTVTGLAMNDEGNLNIRMTVEQWNALPFHVFESQGECGKKENPATLPSRDLICEGKTN